MAHQVRGPGYRVDRRTPWTAVISLWGDLPVAWAGRLAAGLAAHGLDTRRAAAVRSKEHGWLAEFEVEHESRLDPDELDYLAMCKREQGASAELVLSNFWLRREPGAGLELRVVAPDRLGFLAALLGRLAFFSLFPEAMSIATVGDQAHDVIQVRGLAGTTPVAAIEHALRLELSRTPSSAPPPPPRPRRSTPPRSS